MDERYLRTVRDFLKHHDFNAVQIIFIPHVTTPCTNCKTFGYNEEVFPFDHTVKKLEAVSCFLPHLHFSANDFTVLFGIHEYIKKLLRLDAFKLNCLLICPCHSIFLYFMIFQTSTSPPFSHPTCPEAALKITSATS